MTADPAPPPGAAARARTAVRRLPALALALLVAAADLGTKEAAFAAVAPGGIVWVCPTWFGFVQSKNTGVTGGMFAGLDRRILTAFTGLAAAGVAAYLLLSRHPGRLTLFGLALILGGASGNLYDRFRLGYVRDFIDVRPGLPWPAWLNHWPTFNIADSAIVFGVCLLLLHSLLASRRKPAPAPTAP